MNSTDDTRLRASRIKLMAFDIDGVLTEGSLFFTDAGTELKAFYGPDGLGMRLLQKAGITLAIISGRKTSCVDERMKNLGINLVFQGSDDKLKTMQNLLLQLGLTPDEAGFMGDDLIDIRVMAASGFSAMPADGQDCVKPYARLIATKIGGRGAVREVCEYILDAQGKLDAALAPYLPEAAS